MNEIRTVQTIRIIEGKYKKTQYQNVILGFHHK